MTALRNLVNIWANIRLIDVICGGAVGSFLKRSNVSDTVIDATLGQSTARSNSYEMDLLNGVRPIIFTAEPIQTAQTF